MAGNLKRAARQRVLTPRQVASLAESVGLPGQAFQQIARGESGYRVDAVGHDPGGSQGLGLWQITTKYNDDIIRKFGGREKLLTDPVANAKAAKAIYDRQGIKAWYGTKYLTNPNAHYKGRTVDFQNLVPTTRQETTFDARGFDQAKKEFALNQLLTAHHGPKGTVMQRVGLLPDATPERSAFTRTKTVVDLATEKGPSVALPGGGGRTGRVSLAPGADRAGVRTKPIVKQFVGRVAGIAGTPITITTGTNHNQMTTSGNVSDHWEGNAGDIAVPVDSRRGDRIAAAALVAAGVSPAKAKKMARQGGLFTLNHGGRRIQVIWKTYEGGNHHNHVHVGIQ